MEVDDQLCFEQDTKAKIDGPLDLWGLIAGSFEIQTMIIIMWSLVLMMIVFLLGIQALVSPWLYNNYPNIKFPGIF